jgi:hypothetical protein
MLALMPAPFEDVSRYLVSRYLREVVASQPDGRVVLFFGKLNLGVGVVLALSLLFMPFLPHLAWVHVVLFLGMPLIGFVWFLRDMPSPRFTAFEHIMRAPWERKVSGLFQLFPALFPWYALVESHVR